MRLLLILLATSFLTACVGLKPLQNMSELKKDEVAIVTRFVVRPAIGKADYFKSKNIETHKDGSPIIHAAFYKDFKYAEQNVRLPSGQFKDGEFQVIKISRGEKIYYYSAYAVLAGKVVGYYSTLDLPGGMVFDTDKSKVYYIGSLYYKRDAENEVVAAKVVDEYAAAKKFITARLGADVKVKKKLLQAMD